MGELLKNQNIVDIFNKMEYGSVTEDTELARAWIGEHDCIFYAQLGSGKDIPTTETVDIDDLNEVLLAKAYTTPSQLIEKIIESAGSETEHPNRQHLLNKLASEIERHSLLFSQLEIIVRGILSKDTVTKSIPVFTEYLRYYSNWAAQLHIVLNHHKPYGVCAFILDGNTSLVSLAVTVVPALAAGNNVLLLTDAKITPVAFLFAQLCRTAGLPETAVKVVPLVETLQAVISNDAVKHVTALVDINDDEYNKLVIPSSKRFSSLLTGKSAMLVFDSADLDSACTAVIDATWGHLSMLPWSTNTLLVQENIFRTFISKLQTKLKKLNACAATDKMADISTSFDENVRDELLVTLARAKVQGIDVFSNSKSNVKLFPALLIGAKVDGNNVLFGDNNLPFLTVLAFRTTNEAVALANNTRNGLAASIWTEHIGLANEVISKLKVGIVWVNSFGTVDPSITFTPYKESGHICIGGKQGFFEYLKPKTDFKPANLPDVYTKPLSLFYGGGFKKSVGGIINSGVEYPDKKDVRNCVESACKGYAAWSKMALKMRTSHLVRLSERVSTSKIFDSFPTLKKLWSQDVYEMVTRFSTGRRISNENGFALVIREPLGVVVVNVNGPDDIKEVLLLLLAGSSVTLVNRSQDLSDALVALFNIVATSGIPAGTLNLVTNPSDKVLNTFLGHREVNAVANVYAKDVNVKLKNKIFNHWEHVGWTYKSKSIWIDSGESYT